MAKKKGKSPAKSTKGGAASNNNGKIDSVAQDTLKQVRFNSTSASNSKANGAVKDGGMRRSPSSNTLNRLDRETYVVWKRPFRTPFYCIAEIFCLLHDFLRSLLHWRRLVPCILMVVISLCSYFVPGPHTQLAKRFEPTALWCLWWVWLGVLSSIGLGTGLHTFVIFLGPHIAKVTLAAFECNSVNFPEPPYPDDITCPTANVSPSSFITLWDIIGKVRLESLMWGLGTALGELPPYFMARAARISGEEVDDEEYQEYLAYKSGMSNAEEKDIFGRWKIRIEQYMEEMIKKIGFPGILVLASVPNPFFDLAGMTCGHFLIPFWSFFGATVIGKAVVKMHLQMLFVVVLFSEHHLEKLVKLLKWVPRVGQYIQVPLKEFIRAQKTRLHRSPTDPIPEEAASVLQLLMNVFVSGMVIVFLVSLMHSLAQKYHKRCCDSVNGAPTQPKLKTN